MALGLLIAIPVFIHDFLCIHPFNDGNSRMSHLLISLLFYKSGLNVGQYISLEAKIAKICITKYPMPFSKTGMSGRTIRFHSFRKYWGFTSPVLKT